MGDFPKLFLFGYLRSKVSMFCVSDSLHCALWTSCTLWMAWNTFRGFQLSSLHLQSIYHFNTILIPCVSVCIRLYVFVPSKTHPIQSSNPTPPAGLSGPERSNRTSGLWIVPWGCYAHYPSDWRVVQRCSPGSFGESQATPRWANCQHLCWMNMGENGGFIINYILYHY